MTEQTKYVCFLCKRSATLDTKEAEQFLSDGGVIHCPYCDSDEIYPEQPMDDIDTESLYRNERTKPAKQPEPPKNGKKRIGWTDMKDLPVGTKFEVNNGYWEGEIVEENGVKYCLVVATKRMIQLSPDYELDITIEV